MKKSILLLTTLLTIMALAASLALAQAPAAPAAPAGPPVPITDADIKNVDTPKPEVRLKGDPDGALTGTASDVAVGDAKKGLTIGDLVNQVGQNKVAINFVWTLITGFLVMFMQAGFAIVMGGVGGVGNLGGAPPLNTEYAISLFGKNFGLFGQHGLFLTQGGTYDVAVMVVFLFQMVFMDTALTIVTGSAAERWKYAAFLVSSFMLGAFIYPLFGNWAWGGGWLANLGTNFGLGKGYCDFAGSGVVHAVGGLTALVLALVVGPRIGKYTRTGKANALVGHDIVLVLTGCFILAFGWFGFNPGSTLGASGNGNLRIGSIAVNTMLAGMAGGFGAMFYMWMRYGKPDASMSGNGLLAGLVAITAPSGFVNTVSAVIIGLIAGVLVCLSVEFIDRKLKIDDPVGAISVHGANGLWGVISVGLFADGKSNYGGSWNGVTGSVTGLFYGDASQLVAQLIGVATLLGVIFTLGLIVNLVIDVVVGQRVGAKAELEGLDIPEMGQLGYPEFELKPQSIGGGQ